MEELAMKGKALSDPIRLRILTLLARGREETGCCVSPSDCCEGLCVCDLQEALGMAQSKISYHMKELRSAGLVTETQKGKWTYYEIDRAGLEAYLDAIRQQFLGGQAALQPVAWVE